MVLLIEIARACKGPTPTGRARSQRTHHFLGRRTCLSTPPRQRSGKPCEETLPGHYEAAYAPDPARVLKTRRRVLSWSLGGEIAGGSGRDQAVYSVTSGQCAQSRHCVWWSSRVGPPSTT
ncbi:hypothetical protein C8Q79DRAFT_33886 [Trametes meyenii]|nr:hypothetical protein C8Q79DRAFT_33886 [Trametes meyenii]